MTSATTIKQYLEINEWQIAEIKKGIVEADAGKFIEHKKIKGKWRKNLEMSERKCHCERIEAI